MFSLRRKKKHDFIKFVVFSATGFMLILCQQLYPSQASSSLMWLHSNVAFITNITRMPAVFLEQKISDLSYYFDTINENKRLVEENKRLMNFYRQSLKFIAENQELRYLMNMSDYVEKETKVAKVYLDSSSLYANSFLINLGANDGLKPGFAVLTAEGLVGKVLEVSKKHARILLVNDYNSTIPIRILESGVQGLIKGSNEANKLTLITKEVGDIVKVGHVVVTSSVQGLFDDGIPVGIVSKVDDKTIEVTPYANLNRIHQVLVVKRGE